MRGAALVTKEMSSMAAGGSVPPLASFFQVKTNRIVLADAQLFVNEEGMETVADWPVPAASW